MILTRLPLLLPLLFSILSIPVLAWDEEWDFPVNAEGTEIADTRVNNGTIDSYEIWRLATHRLPTKAELIAEVEKIFDSASSHFEVSVAEYTHDDCPSVQHRHALRNSISALLSLQTRYAQDEDVITLINANIETLQNRLQSHEETMLLVCPRRLLDSMKKGSMNARKIKRKIKILKFLLEEASDGDNWKYGMQKAEDIRTWITEFLKLYNAEGGRVAGHRVKKTERQRKTIRGKQ